jgi:hypothetical protein
MFSLPVSKRNQKGRSTSESKFGWPDTKTQSGSRAPYLRPVDSSTSALGTPIICNLESGKTANCWCEWDQIHHRRPLRTPHGVHLVVQHNIIKLAKLLVNVPSVALSMWMRSTINHSCSQFQHNQPLHIQLSHHYHISPSYHRDRIWCVVDWFDCGGWKIEEMENNIKTISTMDWRSAE